MKSILEFAGPLSTLLTFASDGQSELDRYQLYDHKDSHSPPSHFDRLYSPVSRIAKSKSLTQHDLLFGFSAIADRYERFMSLWFDFVKSHPSFYPIFFAHGYEKHGFVETRFLYLMQAAKCFLQDETPPDSDVVAPFAVLRKSLMSSHDQKLRSLDNLTFPSAIQMAMPTLFRKFVIENWHLVESVVGTDVEQFIKVLFATFEYVVQREGPSSDAARGVAILWLRQRLAAVLKICILKRLEFTDDRINEIVATNGEMSHLKTQNAPWDSVRREMKHRGRDTRVVVHHDAARYETQA